ASSELRSIFESNRQGRYLMRGNTLAWTTVSAAALVLLGTHVNAAEFSASFSGFQEIGGLGAGETGAIFFQGKGTLELGLNRRDSTLTFRLSYSGLGSDVTPPPIPFRTIPLPR